MMSSSSRQDGEGGGGSKRRREEARGEGEKAMVVYTVMHESRHLIVNNVPALGCVEDLIRLFALYGPIEEYRMMDEVDCDQFTEIVSIKFVNIANARFAKRKLDGSDFFGQSLAVRYFPTDDSLDDVVAKLEERRRTVAGRLKRLESEPDRAAASKARPSCPPSAASESSATTGSSHDHSVANASSISGEPPSAVTSPSPSSWSTIAALSPSLQSPPFTSLSFISRPLTSILRGPPLNSQLPAASHATLSDQTPEPTPSGNKQQHSTQQRRQRLQL